MKIDTQFDNLLESGNILPMNRSKQLKQKALEALFVRLDEAARQESHQNLEFIVIGSAVLIENGMLERSTDDVDFWGTQEPNKEILKRIAEKAGVAFDPSDYEEKDEPYLQWVTPEFVHMPINENWKTDTKELWSGVCVKINHPPIGVVLGSKLAAARQQDMIDVQYIVSTYPEWRQSFERWLPDFSKEDQEIIADNLIFVEMYLSAAKIDKPTKKALK